ncbi:MAG: hypothetical protein R3344_07445 [Acidobacteriota bacterium]|nr:hypothetical protein [Acidobacteriota bacterium]
MKRTCLRIFLFLLCLTLFFGTAGAGSFEDAVRARWRGAWVVITTDVYSSCTGGGSYHTNKLSGTLVTNRGGHRFVGGEVGKVYKLQLKKKKVDLMISLDEPLLVARQDGPFTLYDERHCAVSLEIQLPRDMTKAKDVEGIDLIVAELVERFDTREAALASEAWNEREREPYPLNYDITVARHAAWRAEQTNLAVDERKHLALEQVKNSGKAIESDPDYLDGLAAGANAMKRWQADTCARLMARFDSVRGRVPEDRREDTVENERWRRGFEDGQKMMHGIRLLERLDGCYVPVPPVPDEAALSDASVSAPSETD